MGKLLKDHEKISWPPLLASVVVGDEDRSTPDYDANLVAVEVFEPEDESVQVKFAVPGGRSNASRTLSFRVKDAALLKPLFKFLSSQLRKTAQQIGETQVDF